MEKHIYETLCLLDNQHVNDVTSKMGIFEYEIRKFTNKYAKAVAENARKGKDSLEIERTIRQVKELSELSDKSKIFGLQIKLDEIYSKKS